MLTKYRPPQDVGQIFTYFKSIKKLPDYKIEFRRGLGFALAVGSLDYGGRFMVFRALTEGLPQDPITTNPHYWRKPIPLITTSILTVWMRAPLEIAQKAFYAD